MRHVTDGERRARLAVRHALAPDTRVETPGEAVRAMTVLHATEAASVFLSCWARTRELRIDDLESDLYVRRSLVRQLAMRRTLFVFPVDLLGAAWGSASARVATAEGTRMAKGLVASGLTADGAAWLERAREEVLAALTGREGGATTAELRSLVPHIDVRVTSTPSQQWTTSRVLTWLGAHGDLLRGAPSGDWRSNRAPWTLRRHWLGDGPELWSAEAGYRELTRRWLRSFGPGTEDDLVWWLGSTRTAARRALSELAAVEVSLDGGGRGWLLPDDLGEAPDPGPWVALLPVLDPTVMGWRDRAFYLGPHARALFDTRGNAGTTVWVDGRAIGCWVQDAAGAVELRLLEAVPARVRRQLQAEAGRLTAWLDGSRVSTVWRSHAMAPAGAH